eukprot:1176366-Prorocentrum_minimum.AAC.3
MGDSHVPVVCARTCMWPCTGVKATASQRGCPRPIASPTRVPPTNRFATESAPDQSLRNEGAPDLSLRHEGAPDQSLRHE